MSNGDHCPQSPPSYFNFLFESRGPLVGDAYMYTCTHVKVARGINQTLCPRIPTMAVDRSAFVPRYDSQRSTMRDVLIVPPKHSWLVTGLAASRSPFRHFGALFRFFANRCRFNQYSESFRTASFPFFQT